MHERILHGRNVWRIKFTDSEPKVDFGGFTATLTRCASKQSFRLLGRPLVGFEPTTSRFVKADALTSEL